jgi:type VI secretion system protein ImpC
MPKPFDFGGVNLTSGGDSSGAHPSSETPFRIAIFGDFSGRGNRGICDAEMIGKRRVVLADRDNFDEVLSRFGAELQLVVGDGSLQMRFSEIEDFHPDRIFEHLEAFGKLRNLRGRLQNPSTFQEAAEELGLHSPGANHDPRRTNISAAVAPDVTHLASASLLDEMIEQTESRASEDRYRRKPDEVRAFAQQVAAEHVVSAPDARQPEILSVIDRGVGALMRAVLHNRDFQALEAIWRATLLLVRHLETGSQLKVYLIDISRDELAEDLKTKDLRDTGIYRLLVEQTVETPGAEPWSIIVGNYSFGSASEDAEVLSRMGQIANRAGAPFVAGASATLLGISSIASAPHAREWKSPRDLAPHWAELRRRPEAESIGLALPRFLLRLPYGRKTVPLESFDFEEFPQLPAHEDYLWGNPGFAVALMLAQSFSEDECDMRGAVTETEIDGLPLHVFGHDGDSESKPCAEILLSEDAAERLLEEGLMPLISFKDRDRIRIIRFQSIADPLRRLAGRWSG